MLEPIFRTVVLEDRILLGGCAGALWKPHELLAVVLHRLVDPSESARMDALTVLRVLVSALHAKSRKGQVSLVPQNLSETVQATQCSWESCILCDFVTCLRAFVFSSMRSKVCPASAWRHVATFEMPMFQAY